MRRTIKNSWEPTNNIARAYENPLGTLPMKHYTGYMTNCACMYMYVCMYVCMYVIAYPHEKVSRDTQDTVPIPGSYWDSEYTRLNVMYIV